ncbi:uncharacterized protein LOC110850254 isoform X2 [Folsomia candida]|uniref:uncharacterized protein LOC110850254 isoform X2 n=1 Tax=Folsomia candida TaxID=158441 RepID=UPI00160532B5|nr:uncharacterized protein LOC110850254 isoform X2 [Folsomia candida]
MTATLDLVSGMKENMTAWSRKSQRRCYNCLLTLAILATMISVITILGLHQSNYDGSTHLEEPIRVPEFASPVGDEIDIFDVNTFMSATDMLVVKYLYQHRLYPPPWEDITVDRIPPSHLPATAIDPMFKLLNASGGGFFIECGANDGKFYSRTLQLEKDFGWGGLLIEASPSLFGKLRKSRRSAWMANVCLSGKIEKVEFKMNFNTSKDWMPGTGLINPGSKYKAPNYKPYGLDINGFTSEGIIDCFPLQSLLAAINRKSVDLFALDVQGHEFQVLQGIPFDQMDIKIFLRV